MPATLTVRLSPELATWLDQTARNSRVPRAHLIRQALERTREAQDRPILRQAGILEDDPHRPIDATPSPPR